jgi:hypothetical protein
MGGTESDDYDDNNCGEHCYGEVVESITMCAMSNCPSVTDRVRCGYHPPGGELQSLGEEMPHELRHASLLHEHQRLAPIGT